MSEDRHDSEKCSCFLGMIDLHESVAIAEVNQSAICYRGKVEPDREALVVIIPHNGIKEFLAGHAWLEKEWNRNPQQYARMIGVDRSDN